MLFGGQRRCLPVLINQQPDVTDARGKVADKHACLIIPTVVERRRHLKAVDDLIAGFDADLRQHELPGLDPVHGAQGHTALAVEGEIKVSAHRCGKICINRGA